VSDVPHARPVDAWPELSLVGRWRLLPSEARLMLLGMSLFSLGTGLTLPFLLVYLHDVRGFSTTTAGLVFGWIAVVSLATAAPWGLAIDRFGPRVTLIAALLAESSGVLAIAFVTTVWQAFAAATLLALGGAGAWPAQTAMLARLVPEGRRTWLFGVQFMLLNLGIGLGGLIAAMIVDVERAGSFQALYVLDALGYLAYVLVLVILPAETGRHAVDVTETASSDVTSGGYRQVVADRVFMRLFLVSVTLIVFGYAQLEVGLTAYVTQVAGVPARWLGVVFATATATIVVGQLLVIRRLEGRSRSGALVVVGVLWGVSWLGVLAAGAAGSLALVLLGLVAATSVFSLGETVWSPTMPALVNELAPDALRGRYNAFSAAAWNVGNVVGPVYAGALIGSGLGQLWAVVTAGGCFLGAVLASRLRRHLTSDQDGRVPPGATMTA
jgi:MFS family permease